MKPLLVLDRDGVLNALVYDTPRGRAPREIKEIKYLVQPSDLELLRSMYSIVCISNQPDLANNKIELETLYEIHSKVMNKFEINHSFICTHNNLDNCRCRKPSTMLLQLALFTNRMAQPATIIGDRWTDVYAGKTLGWKTILLTLDEYAFMPTTQGEAPSDLNPDYVFQKWNDALKVLVNIEK